MNKYTTKFVKETSERSYDWYRGYAGWNSYYIEMNFTRPRKSSQYIQMLNIIKNYPESTRRFILNRCTNGRSSWQILTAMMEYDFIMNVGASNKHKYIITSRGLDLLKRAK